MKKILALFVIVALVSCGSGVSTEVKSDSSIIVVDLTNKDSTVVSVKSAKDENVVEVK